MKNLIILFAVIILASCKKDRVCTCTYPDGTKANEYTLIKVSRKQAKNLCTTTSQNITCTIN